MPGGFARIGGGADTSAVSMRRGGSVADPPELNGLANLLAALLEKGAGDRDAAPEQVRRHRQDLRQEGLNAFPANFLDEESEIDSYSDYVTDAIAAYESLVGSNDLYELNPPALTRPESAA